MPNICKQSSFCPEDRVKCKSQAPKVPWRLPEYEAYENETLEAICDEDFKARRTPLELSTTPFQSYETAGASQVIAGNVRYRVCIRCPSFPIGSDKTKDVLIMKLQETLQLDTFGSC